VYGDGHIHYQGGNFMVDLEDALGRANLFVVGRIGELAAESAVPREAGRSRVSRFSWTPRDFLPMSPGSPSLRATRKSCRRVSQTTWTPSCTSGPSRTGT
jgi:hypothetical protein